MIGEAAAAGLLGIVLHLNASAFQHLHGLERHLGIKLVDDARYKQLYFHDIVSIKTGKSTEFLLITE